MINTGNIEIDGTAREYLIERKPTKTIKYKVYPDLTIKVIVPNTLSMEQIQTRINRRRSWIRKSLEFYSQSNYRNVNRYQQGSTVYYLGKQFRIKVLIDKEESIKLVGRFLVVTLKSKESDRIEFLIDAWYRTHAIQYFNKITTKLLTKLSKYGINQPIIQIRNMKSRWGSCIQNKHKIILNLLLIEKSSICIEYVIMHELCHLKYPNHNTKFYTFFSIVMPDWKIRKEKLEKLKL